MHKRLTADSPAPKAIIVILILVLMACYNTLATAEETKEKKLLFEGGSESIIAYVDSIRVSVVDSISDGCFTNKNAVKTAVELSLRRNGFSVVNSNDKKIFLAPDLTIYSLGYGLKKGNKKIGCVAYVEVMLVKDAVVLVPYSNEERTFVPFKYHVNQTVLSSPDRLNNEIKEYAVSSAEKLMNKILQSRDYMQENWPRIQKNYKDTKKTLQK